MSILLDAAEASIVLKGLSKLPYDATNRLHYLVVHAKEGKFHLLGNGIDQLVGAEEFALWIKNAKKADNVTPVFNTNDKIVLLSCNDAPSSQALADALGELPNTPRSVIAWEGEVEVFENGYIRGNGACKEFSPSTNGQANARILSSTETPKGKDVLPTFAGANRTERVILGNEFLNFKAVKEVQRNLLNSTFLQNFPTFTIDEVTAIMLYIRNDIRNSEYLYSALNRQLREGILDNFNQKFYNLLNQALNKLPLSRPNIVYRGAGRTESTLAKSWRRGQEVDFKDFRSTSLEEEVADNFRVRRNGDVIFQISNAKGRNIDDFSDFEEGEILITPPSKFEVTDIITPTPERPYFIIKLLQK